MQAAHTKNRWLDTAAEAWTVQLVSELVELLLQCQDGQGAGRNEANDIDGFLVEAALGTRVYDSAAQLAIVEASVHASERTLSRLAASTGTDVLALVRGGLSDELEQQLQSAFEADETSTLKIALQQRLDLLEASDKTRTYQEIYGTGSSPEASGSVKAGAHSAPPRGETHNTANDAQDPDDDVDASWHFDDDEDEAADAHMNVSSPDSSWNAHTGGQPLLPDFLGTPISRLAYEAAAQCDFHTLRGLFKRHPRALNRQRMHILDVIPLFCDVADYADLLPQLDHSTGAEKAQPGEAWRSNDLEYASEPALRRILDSRGPAKAVENLPPASAQDLASWYKQRVHDMDRETGQIDNALTLLQHGASQGLPELDALGEQLSLLSRLVYDRRGAGSDAQAWSLAKWQEVSESDIVDAYLADSTPDTIASDIRSLALPYLYVLESQREREGRPIYSLHDEMLLQWILRSSMDIKSSALERVAAVFESSKPTLPASQRIIKDNKELAALTLACCYGHPGSSAPATAAMLRIFDCLPSFDDSATSEIPNQSLANLFDGRKAPVTPRLLSAMTIYETVKVWDMRTLSRALDTLDLHLEGAEIFARWGSPVTLQFLSRLSEDEKPQRLWADRLAKTSAAAVRNLNDGERMGKDFEDEDEWISLLDDLCRLAGKTEYGSQDPKPAFSALDQKEITKIFFSGLLSSAKFSLAKSLFNPSSGERPLDSATEQALVFAASREFYDNADSGNLHSGNMKLAYDCLAVAPSTAEIRRERDFIEATSRLTSFNVLNSMGQPLTPLEIRLAEDKLDLVSQLLSSNTDAYRHPDVLLELVSKLGYRGDPVAETRVLSMLVEAALQANDSKRAGDVCDRMIKAVEQLRRGRDQNKAAQAADLAWRTCFMFGQADHLHDLKRKQAILGQALLLCPAKNMSEVLTIWQINDSTALTPASARSVGSSISGSSLQQSTGGLSLPFSLPSRPSTPSSSHLPHSAESAARAALSVGKAASAYLPFRSASPAPSSARSFSPGRSQYAATGSAHLQMDPPHRDQPSPNREAQVRHAIENRFKAGVGWLLGADEDE